MTKQVSCKIYKLHNIGGELGNITAVTASRRDYLEAIPVERPISSLADALLPETLQWCIERLSQGMRWDELRRRLGLGPAAIDKRWKAIRDAILTGVATDDDDAKKDFLEGQGDILAELRDLADKLDAKINDTEGDKKTHHHFYKYKMEALKVILDQNTQVYVNHVDAQKAKQNTNGVFSGAKITIINNLPRPTQRKVEEISKNAERLLQGDVKEVDE